jgi:hypothetical protein
MRTRANSSETTSTRSYSEEEGTESSKSYRSISCRLFLCVHFASETSPSDSLEIVDDIKSATDGISSRAAAVFHNTLKPAVRDVYHAANEQLGSHVNVHDTNGQDSVAERNSQRKLSRSKRDASTRASYAVNGLASIDPVNETPLVSGISVPNLRNVGNTIVSNAEQAAEVIGPVASQMNQLVKTGADRGLAAWERSGKREAKQLFKQAQTASCLSRAA